MRSRMIADVKWIFFVMTILLVGCSRPVVKPGDGAPLTVSQVKDLEAQVGLALPADVVILNAGDIGRRYTSYNYYFWVLGSTNQIMTDLKASRHPKDDLNKNSSEVIQDSLDKRKILVLTNSYSIRWTTNGYQFYGLLGRSSSGDYLKIERWRY